MTGFGEGRGAGRRQPPRCGPSGSRAMGKRDATGGLPGFLEPGWAYDVCCRSPGDAVHSFVGSLGTVIGGRVRPWDEMSVERKGDSTSAVGGKSVEVSSRNHGAVPGDSHVGRLMGIPRALPGPKDLEVALGRPGREKSPTWGKDAGRLDGRSLGSESGVVGLSRRSFDRLLTVASWRRELLEESKGPFSLYSHARATPCWPNGA
jgi:hypothetical protein